jgi:hypothetical protein
MAKSCFFSLLVRRPNIYFAFTSPLPGTFVIAMHFKGREKAILEMDLKLDDLLEKVIYQSRVAEKEAGSTDRTFFFLSSLATRQCGSA